MASSLQRRTIDRVSTEREPALLEWKTRIFTLLVSFGFVLEALSEIFSDNWNW